MDDLEVNEIPVCCGTFPAVLEVRAARIRYASGDTVSHRGFLLQGACYGK